MPLNKRRHKGHNTKRKKLTSSKEIMGSIRTNDVNKPKKKSSSTSPGVLCLAGLLVTCSGYSVSQFASPNTMWQVWNYGLVTCLSTGLGAIPFIFFQDFSKWWLGVSNAIAAGMMLCASSSLVMEGLNLEHDPTVSVSEAWRVCGGVLLGCGFIISTKAFLDKYEDLKLDVDGLFSERVLLIMAVMTLHSFAEGVGIGVSFGESANDHLGYFITATLAVHNIPEGLAVCLVLIPRGQAVLPAALWAVFSSMPQPVMAVLAYTFVNQFAMVLPIGLGFAAGAMVWVAVAELMVEAIEYSSRSASVIAALASFVSMAALSFVMKGELW